jgi:hypothetical protein
MSRLRVAVLAALILSLSAAPVVQAEPARAGDPGGRVVPARAAGGLTGAELLGAAFAIEYGASVSRPPEPCRRLGRAGRVLAVPANGATTTCTVRPGTPVLVGFGAACSDVEPKPFFAGSEAEQRRCARAFTARYVREVRVSVDDGPAVDLRTRRFRVTSPQVGFALPEDDVFGVDRSSGTLVANAYIALVRGLRRGRHTITVDVVTLDGATTTTLLVDVAGRGHP